MTEIPLLLDENIEPGIGHRLEHYGYAVEHVLDHDMLEEGDPDWKLAEYSLDSGSLIVTYDDDFQTALSPSEYWGILLLSDDDWTQAAVADTVHRILTLYTAEDLQRLNIVGREWL